MTREKSTFVDSNGACPAGSTLSDKCYCTIGKTIKTISKDYSYSTSGKESFTGFRAETNEIPCRNLAMHPQKDYLLSLSTDGCGEVSQNLGSSAIKF